MPNQEQETGTGDRRKESAQKPRAHPVGKKTADPRFSPLVEFFESSYLKHRGGPYISHPADFKQLKNLLERTRGEADFQLPRLKFAIENFLTSKNAFYLGLGKPMSYWAANIHAFITPKPAAAPPAARKRDEKTAPADGDSCELCQNAGRRIVAYDTRRPQELWGLLPWSEVAMDSVTKP
jgi:hypothetical protein